MGQEHDTMSADTPTVRSLGHIQQVIALLDEIHRGNLGAVSHFDDPALFDTAFFIMGGQSDILAARAQLANLRRGDRDRAQTRFYDPSTYGPSAGAAGAHVRDGTYYGNSVDRNDHDLFSDGGPGGSYMIE